MKKIALATALAAGLATMSFAQATPPAPQQDQPATTTKKPKKVKKTSKKHNAKDKAATTPSK